MALLEEFERSGNWLFRWRSYLPLAVLALFLACMPYYEHLGATENESLDHLWEVFCLCVSFFGLGIRVFTIGYTPSGTSGRNTRGQVAEDLNTFGSYSLVRNPLYLGNYFIYLGIALFSHIWWLIAIFTLLFWLYYERIIFAEEMFLRQKFGERYINWAKSVPVIFPKFNGYITPALPFSFKNVLKREYNGFFAIILVMFILETAGELVVHHKFQFDVEWIALLFTSFAIWATLMTLKRKTRLLHVTGR